jgi:hypothetical protein
MYKTASKWELSRMLQYVVLVGKRVGITKQWSLFDTAILLTKQAMYYDLTLRRFRATIATVENQ